MGDRPRNEGREEVDPPESLQGSTGHALSLWPEVTLDVT